MKRSAILPTTSDPWKDFLSLPERNRAARLVGPPQLPMPWEAKVRDGYLTWTWYSPDKGGRGDPPPLQKPPSTLCFDFAQLAHGSDKQICRFADKWGPLGLYKRQEEPIVRWRKLARLALALIRFAGQLVTDGDGDEEDWEVICKSTPVQSLDRKSLPQELQMAFLASAVNTWFARARGHEIMTMVEGNFQVRPSASRLHGVLITQIAHVIARSDQTAVCASCRHPFPPERPITRGSRQYCPGCRKKKRPQRDASRDYRRRGRQQAGSGDDH
jgi:hypothetical protein